MEVITHREPRNTTRSCNYDGTPCWPLLGTPRPSETTWETGPWKNMANRYTFVGLPDGKTFVIWSWAFGRNWAAIDANEQLTTTLRFVQR